MGIAFAKTAGIATMVRYIARITTKQATFSSG